MRQHLRWRTLMSLGVAIPLAFYAPVAATAAATPGGTSVVITSREPQGGGLTPAQVLRLAQNAGQRVIVILRNQYPNLPGRGATRANRLASIASDEAPILAELAQVHAPRVHAYHIINAVAATVSAAEALRLSSFPQVQAVVPDAVVKGPTPAADLAVGGAAPNSTLPPCTFKAELDPEALQLTNTAFEDSSIPQAQNIVTGTGVTVAFLADGVDPNNPDFIRPDGSPVFSDYEDFSGDGANAPTGGGEAFGDASSIAAQGNETYNVNDFIATAHRRPVACPQIKILGVAPGASLMGLKVFSQSNYSFDSNFVQAIEYAVDHGADVINESFGANPFPDNSNDPISLADDAAVQAGVTVVVSSGDAGTMHTIGSPATDPNVIAVGATTQLRLFVQDVDYGAQLGSGGYVSNNISSFSSAGPAQSGQKTVDVVAPGDLGWAVCDPNTAVYLECTDDNGNPSRIEAFGGTSESAPLTAGEAALVIAAYREAHGGASPSPQLVKTIIKSTATSLGLPSYEQGAGLINTLKAVQAALSVKDANGSPTLHGNALLVSPDTLAATANPNTTEPFALHVTDDGAVTDTVRPSVVTLGPATSLGSFTPVLNSTTDPTFVDGFGDTSYYVEQDFTVPAGVQHLTAALSWDIVNQPSSIVRLTLFDPQGRIVQYSHPQDQGPPFPNSGYGNVEVRVPTPGTWRAIVWARDNSTQYNGTVHLDVTAANFVPAGVVLPATKTLAPGQAATFLVLTRTPARPGDESASVVISGTDSTGASAAAGDVPIVLRSLVPLGPSGGSFTGTLTGGNGRFGSPGQTLTYAFDVPAGLHDLELNTAITDTNYNLEGVLVDPRGFPIDVQSTVTGIDPSTGLPNAYTNTMQFFRRDPQAGRWQFVFFINDNTSGAQTSIPFRATIGFNGVSVSASGVPTSSGPAPDWPITATITITNTGNTTKDFFVDPRLDQEQLLSLGSGVFPLPVPGTIAAPTFAVPPEARALAVAAESMSPTVPISMDIYNADGAPPYGGTGSPDIEATSLVDPATGQYAAVATSIAPEVVPGLWGAGPTEVGPYTTTATPSQVMLGATVLAQPFDPSVSSSTGDLWGLLTGFTSGGYSPLTLAPGQTGTITVTFGPVSGTPTKGLLYVDSVATSNGFLITGSGDELVAIPYATRSGG